MASRHLVQRNAETIAHDDPLLPPAEVAADITAFLKLCENGPDETGISTSADRMTDQANFLHAPEGAHAYATLQSVSLKAGATDACVRIVTSMALMLASPFFSMAKDAATTKGAAPTTVKHSFFVPSKTDLDRAIAMVYATKINWWQMNHHTGPDYEHASGFCAKAMRALLIDPNVPDNVHAIWMAAHWFDTIFILKRLGILDTEGTNMGKWSKPASDIVMRTTSSPAGTALWADSYVVLRDLRPSPYAQVVSRGVWVEFEALSINMDIMRRNRARYHMGSEYMTKSPRIIMPELSAALRETVGAALQVCFQGGTIANSKALRNDACPRDGVQSVMFGHLKKGFSGMAKAYVKRMTDSIDPHESTVISGPDWDNVRKMVASNEPYVIRRLEECQAAAYENDKRMASAAAELKPRRRRQSESDSDSD